LYTVVTLVFVLFKDKGQYIRLKFSTNTIHKVSLKFARHLKENYSIEL
jgi:hypothetical protein